MPTAMLRSIPGAMETGSGSERGGGMSFTRLPSRSQTRDIVDTFLGYDRNLRIADGAFCEMTNLSSDKYPMLSPRKPRGTVTTALTGSVTGMISAAQGLYYTEDKYLHPGLGNSGIDMGLTAGSKQMVRMGAYVLIFPDRKYFNTADPEDRGDIDAEFTAADQTRIHICRPNGEDYTSEYISDTEPENPVDKAVWVNTSEYPNTLHQWNEAAKCWTSVTTSCVKLHCMGISSLFKVGDGITISGIKDNVGITDFRTGEPLTDEQREQLDALEGAAVIQDLGSSFGDDYIVIDGILDAECVIAAALTIRRRMPDMDFIVEHGNRLWGCRYGLDAAGEFVNILYASKLGDFRNWTVYRGIDTDSYYANVGTPGPFTGAISYSYGNRVLFFKENGLHTVYGDGPGSFQVEYTACDGIPAGSAGSLVELEGRIYYKSLHGVCVFSGGLPEQIGGAFGDEVYRDAVGGSWKHKYYLGMEDAGGAGHLFAYDTRRGCWHREDGIRTAAIVNAGESAYLLTEAGQLWDISGNDGVREKRVKWMAQTGRLGIDHPDRKWLTRINVRLRLDTGSRFRMSIRYDSTGAWLPVCDKCSAELRAYDFPVRIRRCDHWELKLEGEGPCEVYSIVKTYQTGSDRK